jgi:outer membrane protein TolC
MKIQFVLLIIISSKLLLAQLPDPLTLEYCQERARENYPLSKQFVLLQSETKLKLRNLTSNWLPTLKISGQSTYQSDITSLPIQIPGISIPEVDQEVQKITLDISSTLYDGGLIHHQKILEKTSLSVDEQNIEVELFKLRERVNTVYFNTIILQENEKLIKLMKTEVESRLKIVQSGVLNGVLLQSNADLLKAELIKIDQQLLELTLSKQATRDMLSEYIGETIPINSVLEVPMIIIVQDNNSYTRPELKLMELQSKKLDASRSLLTAKVLPHLAVFGQVGYGKPGLNMFSNEYNDFYIVGLQLSWAPWNWNRTRNDRQRIEFQQNIIQNQKETVEQNIRILHKKDLAEINKYEQLIKKDDEVIALRENIASTFAAQLDKGIITATDYLTELYAETQARLNKQLHIIQLAQAKANYQINYGIEE